MESEASSTPQTNAEAGEHGDASAVSIAADGGPTEQPAREPRPKVFGKYGFAICVLPYFVYWLGTSSVSYFDQSRAHTHVQRQRSLVGQLVEEFKQVTLLEEDPEKAEQLKKLNLDPIVKLLVEAEDFAADEVNRGLAPLLADDSIAPPHIRARIQSELDFLFELVDAEKKHLYRDVLDKGYQRHKAQQGEGAPSVSAWGRWFPADRTWYPSLYTLTVIATAISMLVVAPGYLKAPLNFSWLSIAVGVVGIVVWIGLWMLDRDYLGWFNKIEARAAFNPFQELKDDPNWMWNFIIIRMIGLVLLVPVIEEFFLRGWLMRYIDDPDWDEIPLGTAGRWAIIGVFVYAGFSHPSEAIAALAWFGMVTWLYLKTQSIWNCVIAHLITNLLLGLYVMYTGTWSLW